MPVIARIGACLWPALIGTDVACHCPGSMPQALPLNSNQCGQCWHTGHGHCSCSTWWIPRITVSALVSKSSRGRIFESSPCDKILPLSAWIAPPMWNSRQRHDDWGIILLKYTFHLCQSKKSSLFPRAYSLQWISGSNSSHPNAATIRRFVTF